MFFFRIIIILAFSFFACSVAGDGGNDCAKKIRWKKLRTEKEVKDVLYKCIPAGAKDLLVQEFLNTQGVEYYRDKNIYLFWALTKSGSMWIEKKWLVKIYLNPESKLDSIHVEAGYTGP